MDTSKQAPLADFLPAEAKKGYRGFYPHPISEWSDLPLPLRCFTFDPCVAYIEVDLYIGCGRFVIARLTPEECIRTLFCQTHDDRKNQNPTIHLRKVVRHDGQTIWCSWRQDPSTGAYCIVGNSGVRFVVQGGFDRHLPANCYRPEAGSSAHKAGYEWQIDSCVRGTGCAL